MNLADKNIIVAGGAGRIGSVVAAVALARGANVMVADLQQAAQVDDLLRANQDRSAFVEMDITNTRSVEKAVRATVDRFGPLSGAVQSAYPKSDGWGTRFEDLEPANLSFDLMSQLGGTILFAQNVIPALRENGAGGLVLVSSIQGLGAPKFRHYEGTDMTSPIEYSAIKAGVNAVARYLAKYLVGEHITVNAVSPGGIEAGQPESFQNRYSEECVNKGMLDPEDVAGTVCFLLSEDARYITGQIIVVDDGWSV